jgi:hypothetical protein
MRTEEPTTPEQVTALRALIGAQWLRLAGRLYCPARKMEAAGLCQQHPGWPDHRLDAGVHRIFTPA